MHFSSWFTQLQSQLLKNRHRSLLLLKGEENWAKNLLVEAGFFSVNVQEIAHSVNSRQVFSDNVNFPATITRQTYRRLLGTENHGLVFCDSQFDIEALAALSGTIAAGGVMVVVLNNSTDSLFIERLLSLLSFNTENYLLEQEIIAQGKLPDLAKSKTSEPVQLVTNVRSSSLISEQPLTYGNEEQVQAVAKIIKVLKGHRDRPLVLTADRGRGKSTALALACCQILNSANQAIRIVITAPNLSSLNVFFEQLHRGLPDGNLHKDKFIHSNGSVEFLAIDHLLESDTSPALVLVDEAAGLPVYLLEKLVTRYHRVVFSSTVHGYEGAGRGFTLKFYKTLDTLKPNWQKCSLHQPIRWAAHDPLESFIFKSCLLNAELADVSHVVNNFPDNKTKENAFEFKLFSGQQLLNNEALLAQIFATLVTAHYQTSPSDLKQLLDNEQIKTAAFLQGERVIAVAMLLTEGQCSVDEVQAVKTSQRRLKNQFLPQSLFTHCGIESAFNYRYLRVMRIAVHPQLQSKAIGGEFLAKISAYARHQGFDFIGASFGVNHSLLGFWLQGGFELARIGFSQDKASGENSALVLQGLNEKATALMQTITQLFYQQFDYLLTDEYQHLPAKLVWKILHASPEALLPLLTASDKKSVVDFSHKTRLYSSCVYALHRWLILHCQQKYSPEVLVLITRILQKKSIAAVCQQFGFTGKKALNTYLVDYVSKHSSEALIN